MKYGYPKWDYKYEKCHKCGLPKEECECMHEPMEEMDCIPKCEKECVKTYKCTYKLYRICCYRLYKCCMYCGHEYDYHRYRGMCPKCGR